MTAATASIQTEDPFVEAQVQQLLQEAGLDAAPFDPASFEALKKYMQQQQQQQQDTKASPKADINNKNTAEEEPSLIEEQSPPLPDPSLPLLNVDIYGPTGTAPKVIQSTASLEQRQALFYPMGSDMTDPGSSVRRVRSNVSNISAISGTSLTTKTEARILEQLQVQTTLILQLQRRVDELTTIVHQQQQQQPIVTRGGGGRPQLNRLMSELTVDSETRSLFSSSAGLDSPLSQQQQQQQRLVVDHTPILEEATNLGDAPTEAAVAPAAPRQVPPPRAPGLFRRLVRPLARNGRMAKLYQVYIKLRKQQVQDIQWGVIVKVVVMLSILLGRIMSRTKQQKGHAKDADGESSVLANVPFKVYVLVAVAFLGLLAQAGYLSFLYKFFIQERYPHRILVLGEDADAILQELEDLARPDPQRRAAAAAAAAQQQEAGGAGGDPAAMNWDQTFLLGGRIAPRVGGENNDPQEQPPQPVGLAGALANFLYDIVYLIGSFFLSIFPMWRPQPVRRPAVAGEGEGEEEPTQQQDQQGGPGQVRPPGDPAENDDDDEEEEEEDDGVSHPDEGPEEDY